MTIRAKLFFDGVVGDDEVELASDIEAGVIASFPEHDVGISAKRYDMPQPLNNVGLEAWVIWRVSFEVFSTIRKTWQIMCLMKQ